MSLLQLSICASEPQKVDYFLRLLWVVLQCSFRPFPNCWIAIYAKDDGTAKEVFPTTHILDAGKTKYPAKSRSAMRHQHLSTLWLVRS